MACARVQRNYCPDTILVKMTIVISENRGLHVLCSDPEKNRSLGDFEVKRQDIDFSKVARPRAAILLALIAGSAVGGCGGYTGHPRTYTFTDPLTGEEKTETYTSSGSM